MLSKPLRACCSSQSIGTKNDAGAPNIEAFLGAAGAVAWSSPNGAFAYSPRSPESNVAVSDLNSGERRGSELVFNASNSNNIYGNNNTIMPDSINIPCIIYLGK